MAAAGTVAVLLPGAFYILGRRVPPIDLPRRRGVPMAVATDCNPGTSPVTCRCSDAEHGVHAFRLTPEEALAGVTMHAARALGLEREVGTVSAGKAADLSSGGSSGRRSSPTGFGRQMTLQRVQCAGRTCRGRTSDRTSGRTCSNRIRGEAGRAAAAHP